MSTYPDQAATTASPVAFPGAVPPDTVLEIRDLSVVYRTPGGDVRAVDRVNLDLAAGEVVGLAGESGSGKSTLVYGASRLLRAPALITNGSVRYSGRRVSEPVDVLTMKSDELRRLRWREIAIVFQSAMNALNPVLNVRDQLTDVMHAHLRIPRDEAREKAASLLDLVGIPRSRLRSYPHELSGGMRQRVMIAMALSCNPKLLIADEPTTALDVTIQAQILDLLTEMKARLGMAVMLITHAMGVVAETAQRVVVMYAGRVVEEASVEALFAQPLHPYTQGLIRSIPRIDKGAGKKLRLEAIGGVVPSLIEPPPGCRFAPRCKFVTPACTEAMPELRAPEAGHKVACILY